ncbi:MAG: peptidylprolyl isomerase [Candidatus Ancaeobacter aquaticus]|nr:peptidylprolyl isomerase [Candidatus Ancaeobacter aquaticus]
MKRFAQYIVLVGIALNVCCFAYAEVVDQIVAIVNDEIVTFNELKKVLNPIYAQYEKTYQSDELVDKMIRARNEVLKQLINNKLLVQAAKTKKLTVDEDLIEERIDSIKERFPSEEVFYSALEADGMSVDILKKNIREQLLMRSLVQRELAHKAIVSPHDVNEFYKKHTEQFREGEMINLCNILIKHTDKDDEGSDKAWDKINNILREIKNGGDFEVLAKQYSEGPNAEKGGDMGYFPRGSMMKEIEEAAFSMNAGEISEIIRTNVGYHILYLKARRSARQIPFQEVSKDVERELFQVKIEKLKAEYVDDLRKKAFIKVME